MATGWKNDYLRYKSFFLNVLSVYNTKPNLKIYLELILSIATVVVFSIFAIRPTIVTIISLNNEIKAKEETSTQLKQKVRNLQTAGTLMQSQADNLIYVDQAVPKSAMPDILVKQVETLANESSLQILGFSSSDITLFGQQKEGKKSKNVEPLSSGSDELAFTFSATGSYQNIISFLTRIENLRRPVKFDSFAISSNITDSGTVIILSVTGRVPYLLDK